MENWLQAELTAFYTLYEGKLQDWVGSYPGGVSCQKGCSTCCNVSVGLYLPEAIVLANRLTDGLYAQVKDHAQRVVRYARTTTDYVNGYRFAGLGCCPFLEPNEGVCRIYDSRPANCRHVFSNMPPEYCSKDAPRLFEYDPDKHAEFLKNLEPGINEGGLPYIAPLHNIFYEKYEGELLALTAKYFHFSLIGEMSWLIVLAREYDLWDMTTNPDTMLPELITNLQRTGFYHENLLTECKELFS